MTDIGKQISNIIAAYNPHPHQPGRDMYFTASIIGSLSSIGSASTITNISPVANVIPKFIADALDPLLPFVVEA